MQSLPPISPDQAAAFPVGLTIPVRSAKLRAAVHEVLVRAAFTRRVVNRLKRQLGKGTVSNTLPAS